jgi:hypothetical protein
MKTLYWAFGAVGTALVLAIMLYVLTTPAAPAPVAARTYAAAGSKVLVVSMPAADQGLKDDFRELQKRAMERNIRWENYTEKEPYVPESCDSGARSPQYIQMHCGDNLF